MDFLDTLLQYTHITKKDIDQFHFWLRTDPVAKAEASKKEQTKGEILAMMVCFASRLTIPEAYDENMKVSADDLLRQILAGTAGDEKSAFFLFETLTRAKLVLLTPEPAKGADFETESTYIYLNPLYVTDYRNCRDKAYLYDCPQTH